ncbi:hypothetical protein COOONC_08793 [Cooperia oncophora]
MIKKKCTLLLMIMLDLLFMAVDGLRVKGKWDTAAERVRIVTKFGFQQTSALDRENTRGFVFGNVTAVGATNTTETDA